MTRLEELIFPHLEKTTPEIVDVLNAKTISKVDSQLWTWGGLNQRFDTAVVGTIAEVLSAIPGTKAMQFQLINPGVDFSLDKTQEVLESLRGVPKLSSFIDALKAIGRWSNSPFNEAGFEGEVTKEEVALIREDLITRSEAGAYWARVLAVVNPMINAGNTAAEIKAASAGVE